jgi:hypothetical protein
MQISDHLWQEIIVETKAQLADLEARCIAEGLKDSFAVRVEKFPSPAGQQVEMLLTEQEPFMHGRPHVFIRYVTTGEMRAATRKKVGRDRYAISWKSTDPKGWAELVGKPASAWVKELKLTDFWVISATTVTTSAELVERSHEPKPAA